MTKRISLKAALLGQGRLHEYKDDYACEQKYKMDCYTWQLNKKALIKIGTKEAQSEWRWFEISNIKLPASITVYRGNFAYFSTLSFYINLFLMMISVLLCYQNMDGVMFDWN